MTETYELENKRVWIAGHNGLLGSSIRRRLLTENCDIITVDRKNLDLRKQSDVEYWISKKRPNTVIISAATVGGIYANSTRPAEFLYDNLMIEANIIEAARKYGIEKLLFLGSSCAYPKAALQPMEEEILLSGRLEKTNEYFSIAKIAGIKLCEAYRKQYGCNFISAIPANLYGPQDNFDLYDSHVIPALIQKMHHARMQDKKSIQIWGTGMAIREFLFVDDCADAVIFLLKKYNKGAHINIGSGEEITIKNLAHKISRVVDFNGHITFDTTKPDGAPKKVLNGSRLRELGWIKNVTLDDGISLTYEWFENNLNLHSGN